MVTMQSDEFLNLLVYSDSLAFRRPGDSADFGVTYPFLLQQSLSREFAVRANLMLRGGGGRRSAEIRRTFEHDASYFSGSGERSNVVIFQFGIVDCAPRPITYRVLPLLRRFPIVGNHVVSLLSDNRAAIQRTWSYTFTSPRSFEMEYTRIFQASRSANRLTLCVGMPLPPETIEGRSPGFRAKVLEYNALIRRVSGDFYCDIEEALDEATRQKILLDDGHHLSASGHHFFASKIMECLRRVL